MVDASGQPGRSTPMRRPRTKHLFLVLSGVILGTGVLTTRPSGDWVRWGAGNRGARGRLVQWRSCMEALGRSRT